MNEKKKPITVHIPLLDFFHKFKQVSRKKTNGSCTGAKNRFILCLLPQSHNANSFVKLRGKKYSYH